MWDLSKKQLLEAVKEARRLVRFFNDTGRQPNTDDYHIHFAFSEVLDAWTMYVFTGSCGGGRTIKKDAEKWSRT